MRQEFNQHSDTVQYLFETVLLGRFVFLSFLSLSTECLCSELISGALGTHRERCRYDAHFELKEGFWSMLAELFRVFK